MLLTGAQLVHRRNANIFLSSTKLRRGARGRSKIHSRRQVPRELSSSTRNTRKLSQKRRYIENMVSAVGFEVGYETIQLER
jgi:hypothetical protein